MDTSDTDGVRFKHIFIWIGICFNVKKMKYKDTFLTKHFLQHLYESEKNIIFTNSGIDYTKKGIHIIHFPLIYE